ncbi:hypothetical protein OUZ56_033922 [Daphnia magna]|uniref:Uncharacterized protein n=1 Tax=Daphnia magna TaxID=35525 RepID=A0ABR0BB92_9CRUS|nr:hypothetical protein OUZ56_033922 [Daphnia magna]
MLAAVDVVEAVKETKEIGKIEKKRGYLSENFSKSRRLLKVSLGGSCETSGRLKNSKSRTEAMMKIFLSPYGVRGDRQAGVERLMADENFDESRRGYLPEIEMKNFLSPYGFWSEFRAVDGSRPAAWNIHDAE